MNPPLTANNEDLAASPQPRVSETAYGAIFTQRWVVEMILDLAGFVSDRDLGSHCAIEPACGQGAFLVPMVERISEACIREGRLLSEAQGTLHAYDLQKDHVTSSRKAVTAALVNRGWTLGEAIGFAKYSIRHGDFLLQEDSLPKADFVIGNPPYIRLEAIPEARSAAYRHRCKTMAGRADVYVGFFEIGLRSLKPEGVLSYICADRWMRNQYGRHLRQFITADFSVDAAIEVHAVDAFDTEVSAYPSISKIRRGAQRAALIAETTSAFNPADAKRLISWAEQADVDQELNAESFRAALLPRWFDGTGSWPSGSPKLLTVLKHLEDSFPTLESLDTGTKVGIGVATGADQVFITTDPSIVESDRLLPLAMAPDTTDGQFKWSKRYLVNPWASDGSGLVDLSSFPRLSSYFETHSKSLSKRHVAKSRPKDWYRTIDRVHGSLTTEEKLLFPDIKAEIHPVLDRGTSYPHHNLYFVISRDWDLEVLGGLLLSRVAQLFIEAYAVRMRGKYLRFQAQYLRRICVPHPAEIKKGDARALRKSFSTRDVEAATKVAEQLYGVDLSEIK